MVSCFSEEGAKPQPFLLVKVGPWKVYLIRDPERIAGIWKQALDPDDPLVEIVTETDLFLDFPLVEGKPFGESGQLTRNDASYAYLIEGKKPFVAAGLAWAPAPAGAEEFTLLFRTRSDHSTWKFVPGLGFTGFAYSHHGTTSEVDCRLKEYRP